MARICRCALLLALFMTSLGYGATLTVAVASNFYSVAQTLGGQFEKLTGHDIRIAQGSTGQHYAQIHQGAPFDLFMAADVVRPRQLEQDGLGIPGTRATYAVGQLVLWVPDATVDRPAIEQLKGLQLTRLAIANARLAPYGAAAETALDRLGLLLDYRRRLVRGNNIGQTYQFVATGNAPAGLVALSQTVDGNHPPAAIWRVPETLHEPIEQQLILLTDSDAARQFRDFVLSPDAARVIREAGYAVPAS